MIINRKCESWKINLVVMESLYHLKLGESYYFSTKYSRSVLMECSCDLDGSGSQVCEWDGTFCSSVCTIYTILRLIYFGSVL
ncbi:unnamed protein product [Brassica napus]|uniref:(rape) hypothetical protein n=1 Tax=Brassica napus TaxID=3708 RepID=A0A816SIX2_BRANA|nr:unnamed protein product [Brassica napus]